MSDLPVITMTGGLVDMPELRFTPSGHAVVNFRIAGRKRVKDAQGQWVDGDPIYLSVSAWNKMAENVAETLTRLGQRVTVSGHLAQQWWEKDGQKQSKYVIEADTIAVDLMFRAYDERAEAPRAATPSGADPWGTPATLDEPPF